jgi:AcrR family transcriptional regulator
MLREMRKKQTKEAIIKHAIELFKQKGYENVTVEEITTACGIAKGTFFNYFPKKEYILLYLMDSYMGLLDDIVEKNKQDHVKDRLLHIFQDILHIFFRYSDLLRLALEETLKSAIRSPEQTTNIKKFQTAISTILLEAQNSGCLNSKWEADMVASILVGDFLHTIVTMSSDLNESQLAEVFKQHLDIMWEGIVHG